MFERNLLLICNLSRILKLNLLRGVETCAHGAQGVRGLKRDFWEKLRFYWVKMDFEEKIDAFGEKLDENSQIKTI